MWINSRRCWLGAVALVVFAAVGCTKAGEGRRIAGFLGCRFSEAVCQPGEQCVDDRLFGSCQPRGAPVDEYQYYPDERTLALLEAEVYRLISAGKTWNSLYTQCVLGNILLAFRKGLEPDTTWCDQKDDFESTADMDDELAKDTTQLLQQYISNYNPSRNIMDAAGAQNQEVNEFDYSNESDDSREKKDEFLKIHKYWVNIKRDSQELQDFPEFPGRSPSPDDSLDELLDQLNPDDIAALQGYLQGLSGNDVLLGGLRIPDKKSRQDEQDSWGYTWGGDEEPVEQEPLGSMEGVPMDKDPLQEEDLIPQTDTAMMSPPDAKLLSDLLEERVSVNELSDEDIERMSRYVDYMVNELDENEPKHKGLMPSPPKVDTEEDGGDSWQIPADESAHVAVKKEQMNSAVIENPNGNAHVRVQLAESPEEQKRVSVAMGPGLPEGVTEDDSDHHDHHFDDDMPVDTHTEPAQFDILDGNYVFIRVVPQTNDAKLAARIVETLEKVLRLPEGTLALDSVENGDITFHIVPGMGDIDATMIARQAVEHAAALKSVSNLTVTNAGFGKETKVSVMDVNGPKYFMLTFILCGVIAGIMLLVIALYIVRRHSASRQKLAQLTGASVDQGEASKVYQDLCRQRMQSKSSEKPEPLSAASRVSSVASENAAVGSPSSRSSTSSWSEEPVTSNMDISTGHIVLSYMEDHLKNKDRLDQEWDALVAYEAEPNSTATGADQTNMRKNRYSDVLPYDHSRVILSNTTNVSSSDYINANTITDHDPRNPAYIATQGPLPHTVADFWQMVWEQGSVVVVMLTKLTENGVAMCHRYWPEEGSDLYHIYEVHLVSEHIWCDDYLVRSFYLKNLQTNETRTVTQFHFLTWPDLGIPASTKALLDFRRKVNKSYRGRSCPIVVHCSDGAGRTGTYTLIDMVLNRLSKGAKEIDIAATLEHIRDQRGLMVKTKEQFEFALASVAEEVHAILKALPQ